MSIHLHILEEEVPSGSLALLILIFLRTFLTGIGSCTLLVYSIAIAPCHIQQRNQNCTETTAVASSSTTYKDFFVGVMLVAVLMRSHSFLEFIVWGVIIYRLPVVFLCFNSIYTVFSCRWSSVLKEVFFLLTQSFTSSVM